MSGAMIHPSAVVDPRARLADDVRIGPLCYVGADVELGPGCELHAQVTLLGPARIGAGNIFFPQCIVGAGPQDLKYRGGPTRLEIGDHNVFRELVTVHRGTEVDEQSGGVTRIGHRNVIMVGVHVAHDVHIGNHCIISNSTQLAGHVRVEDYANISGFTGMHHFVTIGRYAFVAGMTRLTSDVPPYMIVAGYQSQVRGVNIEGMRRWRLPPESIEALRQAYRRLWGRRDEGGPAALSAGLREIRTDGLMQDPHVRYLVDFLSRKIDQGVYGRSRERHRRDCDRDREGFYGAAGPEARP